MKKTINYNYIFKYYNDKGNIVKIRPCTIKESIESVESYLKHFGAVRVEKVFRENRERFKIKKCKI